MAVGGKEDLRVAIAGFGAIGKVVAAKLDAGIPGLRLVAIAARDAAKARAAMAGLSAPVPILPLGELASVADIVIESLPAAAFDEVAVPTLEAGRILLVSSVGALTTRPHLEALAAKHGGQIMIPTGALLGLDALTAAREGEITSVKMVSRKPPRGLVGAPYLIEHNIDVEAITVPTRIFAGSAKEAAKWFPANLNVAAAVGFAGIGTERTELELWADPTIDRNIHTIEVIADSANFSMTIANVPSEDNPRTGKITALSLVAALRKLRSPMRVGT